MRILIDRSVVGTAEVIHDDGETRRFMESVSTLDSRDSVIENTCDMFGVMYNLGIFFVEISDDVECAMNKLVGAMEYIRSLSTTVEKIKRLENKMRSSQSIKVGKGPPRNDRFESVGVDITVENEKTLNQLMESIGYNNSQLQIFE